MKTLIRLTVALTIAVPLFGQTPFNNSAWSYDTKQDIAGKVTETAITDQTSGRGTADSVVIRCKATCEVYIHIGNRIVEEQSSVRVRFNDHSPTRYAVSVGEGSTSLFFESPVSILRAIRDNGGYMTVEYSPYQRQPVMVTFGIWNLPPSILSRITKAEGQLRKKQIQGKAEEQAQHQAEQAEQKLQTEEAKRFFDVQEKINAMPDSDPAKTVRRDHLCNECVAEQNELIRQALKDAVMAQTLKSMVSDQYYADRHPLIVEWVASQPKGGKQ